MFKLLKANFPTKLFAWSYFAGLLIGIAGWVFGTSSLPPLALSLASGFGWFFLALVLINVPLSVVAFKSNTRRGHLSAGDANNSFRFAAPTAIRAIAVLLGTVSVAFVCWIVTTSSNALGVVIYGSFLCLALLWIWFCLVVIDDALTKQRSKQYPDEL